MNGESDGVNYIAMELIDGVTLREKIHQEQTDLRKRLRYLQHVAEGLAKAHAASARTCRCSRRRAIASYQGQPVAVASASQMNAEPAD